MLPYEGIRVLDLAGPMGAYATKLLARLGADVVLVEPPEGSSLRRRPPLAQRGAMAGCSLPFAYYSGGKRSITLRSEDPGAEAVLMRLASAADVIFVAPGPERSLVGFTVTDARPALSWAGPQAIVICLTSFGLTGPWARLQATPLISYALSGAMWSLGAPSLPPPAPPGQQVYDQFSLHGLTAALTALRERPAVGAQVVDLSLHEMFAVGDGQVTRYARSARFLPRAEAHVGAPPTGVWACADGLVELMVHNPPQWHGFFRVVGQPDELNDPSLAERPARYERAEWLAERTAFYLSAMSLEDAVSRCERERVPCGPFYLPEEFVEDRQAATRGYWANVQVGEGDGIRIPGDPWRSEPSTFADSHRPPPALGEHNEQVYLRELGFTAADLRAWRASGLV